MISLLKSGPDCDLIRPGSHFRRFPGMVEPRQSTRLILFRSFFSAKLTMENRRAVLSPGNSRNKKPGCFSASPLNKPAAGLLPRTRIRAKIFNLTAVFPFHQYWQETRVINHFCFRQLAPVQGKPSVTQTGLVSRADNSSASQGRSGPG